MNVVKEPLLNLWYRALHSPHGIEILCSDPDPVRMKLYKIRREVKDPDLDQIVITPSPFDPMRFWLIKKEPTDDSKA